MPKPVVRVVAVSLALLSAVAQAQLAASENWRLQSSQSAPRAPETKVWGPQPPAEMRIDAHSMSGPVPLTCSAARHHFERLSPEGFFEGNLPTPAARAAKQLGLPSGPLTTQRIICSSGSFDFHRDGAGHAWLGLDNRVLRFDRVAAMSSPVATVQALLLEHFSTDMALGRASLAAKAPWLTPTLQQRLDRWLARPPSPNEVPDLNGDPFTDSQEPPLAFELLAVRIRGSTADVTVRFEFEGEHSRKPVRASKRDVVMQVVHTDGGWRIEDLRYADGSRLSQLLGR